MIALRPAILVVALAAALHGAFELQPPPRPGGIAPPPPPSRPSDPGSVEPTAIVRGRVVGSDGRPLRQARVSIVEGTTRRSLTETTDAEGRFEIATVPAGTYAVTARKTGFATMEYGQRKPSDPGR